MTIAEVSKKYELTQDTLRYGVIINCWTQMFRLV